MTNRITFYRLEINENLYVCVFDSFAKSADPTASRRARAQPALLLSTINHKYHIHISTVSSSSSAPACSSPVRLLLLVVVYSLLMEQKVKSAQGKGPGRVTTV